MPAYGTLAQPPALYAGDSYLAFNAEAPVSGTLSERVAISSYPDGNPSYCSVEFSFTVAPTGSWEIDIQEADTDIQSYYLGALGGPVTQVDANNVWRVDLNAPVTAKFLAIYVKVAPTYNGGFMTVKVTKQ